MKNSLILIAIVFKLTNAFAQDLDKNKADYKLGEGVTFSFNHDAYQFNIGGFIQPSVQWSKTENTESENLLNVKYSFLTLSGKALKEKVSFLIETDFSDSKPLMDAWVAYQPTKWIKISAGQKQTFTNNREMTFKENKIEMTDRSLLSQNFSNTGREFGLFVETKFGKKIGLEPKFALTSGDGRNSFGSDSRDTDKGGLKYGGRIDIYPLGFFSEGNSDFSADILHEPNLKMLIGTAFSKNYGASSAKGEGHGDFIFYDINGKENQPDYSQFFVDMLIKYKGFSVLAEYADSNATDLGIPFTDAGSTTLLTPTEISQYLVLGKAYNFQLGYVTKSGWGIDGRYVYTEPEFEDNLNSILKEFNSYSFGLTKYFKKDNLKFQAAFTRTDFKEFDSNNKAELIFQIMF